MQKDKKRSVPTRHQATQVYMTAEEAECAERAERWAIICKLNPGGMTGDARKINKQKLAFEGQ